MQGSVALARLAERFRVEAPVTWDKVLAAIDAWEGDNGAGMSRIRAEWRAQYGTLCDLLNCPEAERGDLAGWLQDSSGGLNFGQMVAEVEKRRQSNAGLSNALAAANGRISTLEAQAKQRTLDCLPPGWAAVRLSDIAERRWEDD